MLIKDTVINSNSHVMRHGMSLYHEYDHGDSEFNQGRV